LTVQKIFFSEPLTRILFRQFHLTNIPVSFDIDAVHVKVVCNGILIGKWHGMAINLMNNYTKWAAYNKRLLNFGPE